MAFLTRAAASAPTPRSSLTTRETVFRLTPAARATSRMVERGLMFGWPPPWSDNVVALKHDKFRLVNPGGRRSSPLLRQRCLAHKAYPKKRGQDSAPPGGRFGAAPTSTTRPR